VIYLGHGKVVAAPHTGTNVQVENLSDFQGRIVGARRILANPQGHVYRASAFGAGGSMPGDAARQANGLPPQQVPGMSGGNQAARQQAALALLQSSQAHIAPMPNLPTAQGTIQGILQAHSQPLQPASTQAPALSALQGTLTSAPSQMPDYASQLGNIHTQLLKQVG
jgi:hypothetical protein